MKYEYHKVTDYLPLYDYYCKVKNAVPYWFDADHETWRESFCEDTDYDGEEMFSELFTYAAKADGEIAGFIQFGISRYIYGTDGEKDHTVKGGIIRQLYFDKGQDCGEGLISIAEKYFSENNIQRKFAFFHAFGMTCNAGHGKLFCGLPHIEKILLENNFVREHENVYYKRDLDGSIVQANDNITINYAAVNPKGLCEFSISSQGKYVGAGALVFLPQGGICYLKWIYIEDSEQRKGYASAALNRIFSDMYKNGIRRIDTDTADGNLIAQMLYLKTGFADMGRTRSYQY